MTPVASAGSLISLRQFLAVVGHYTKEGTCGKWGCTHLTRDLKSFSTPKGLLVPKKFPNNVHVPTCRYQPHVL